MHVQNTWGGVRRWGRNIMNSMSHVVLSVSPLGGGFKYSLFSPLFGEAFPIWLIFFKWVGSTTNQSTMYLLKKTASYRSLYGHNVNVDISFWEACELKTRRGIFYNFLLVVLMWCWYMLMSHFGICWWCWCDFLGGGLKKCLIFFCTWPIHPFWVLNLFGMGWFQPAATVLQAWLSDRSMGGINEVALSNTQHRRSGCPELQSIWGSRLDGWNNDKTAGLFCQFW